MYTPKKGWFAEFTNSDEQCGFGIHLAYIVEDNAIVFGIQFLTLQFVLGYDFSPDDN